MDTRDHHKAGSYMIEQNSWNKTAPPTNFASKFSASKPSIRFAADAVPNSSSAIPSFIAPVGHKHASATEVSMDSDLSPSNDNSESESGTTSDSESQQSGGDHDNGVSLPPKRPLKLAGDSDTCSPLPVKPEQQQQQHNRHTVADDYGTLSRRRAARNIVTYSELAPASSEEESPSRPDVERGRRRDSDSDFVMSEGERGLRGATESSSSSSEEEDDVSEEEYRPTYRKKATSTTKKSKVSFWVFKKNFKCMCVHICVWGHLLFVYLLKP